MHHPCLHEQLLITMSSQAQCSLHSRLDWHQQTQAAPSRQSPLQHTCSLLRRGIRDDCQSPHARWWTADSLAPTRRISDRMNLFLYNGGFSGSPILTSHWQPLFLPHGPRLGVAAMPPSTQSTMRRAYGTTPQHGSYTMLRMSKSICFTRWCNGVAWLKHNGVKGREWRERFLWWKQRQKRSVNESRVFRGGANTALKLPKSATDSQKTHGKDTSRRICYVSAAVTWAEVSLRTDCSHLTACR